MDSNQWSPANKCEDAKTQNLHQTTVITHNSPSGGDDSLRYKLTHCLGFCHPNSRSALEAPHQQKLVSYMNPKVRRLRMIIIIIGVVRLKCLYNRFEGGLANCILAIRLFTWANSTTTNASLCNRNQKHFAAEEYFCRNNLKNQFLFMYLFSPKVMAIGQSLY